MCGDGGILALKIAVKEYPQEESNFHFSLRRGMFYPLNYEDRGLFVGDAGFEPATSATRMPRASQLRQSPFRKAELLEFYYFTLILKNYLINGFKNVSINHDL